MEGEEVLDWLLGGGDGGVGRWRERGECETREVGKGEGAD